MKLMLLQKNADFIADAIYTAKYLIAAKYTVVFYVVIIKVLL